MVAVSPGKRVLICEPTFTLYRQVATIMGGTVSSVSLAEDFAYDAPALLSAVKELQPDVTIICSPNNPTGSALSDADLSALLRQSPGLVVVDEAYHEFSAHSVVPLLREHDNLIVLRTFSKAMAMAAFRIGYLLSSSELVREIGKALLPYNLNFFSQTAAHVALDLYDSELRPLVDKIVYERARVFEQLREIEGLSPVASQANFMIVRSRVNPKEVFAQLLQKDVLIRDVSSYPMLSDYFRISIGTPAENNKLISALKEM
jgi:histidinol-phosphate aminotransferase